MSEQLHYPLTRDEYGNSMWKVMHSYTANLPDKLSSHDRRNFKHTLLDLINKFPCDDCKGHALSYIKENKPKRATKEGYFMYLCDFHNHVNEQTGKPKQDCNMIYKPSSCPTCTSTVSATNEPSKSETDSSYGGQQHNKPSNHISQTIDYKLSQQLGDYKSTSRKIFEKMCSNAGVVVPELIFTDKTACSDPNTSCTHLTVNPTTKQLVDGTKVYFNVNQYSPRTAVHEALHYIRKAKGLDALNEDSVEKEARQIISRDFPIDYIKNPSVTSNRLYKEPVSPVVTEVRDTPMDSNYFKERASRRLKSVSDNFPYFSKYYGDAKKHKKEEPAPQVVPTMTYSDGRPVYPQVPTQVPEKEEPQSATEGFTSMLNPIYAPFANLLGLKPEDVNNAHTPALLANGAIVLVESNLNKFGSMAISLLASITTLAIGTLAKDSIGYADKKLLVGLGGAFLWSGALRYIANPKIHEEVVSQAMDFGSSLGSWDFEAMAGSMTGDKIELDPEDAMVKGKMQPRPLRQNLSAPVGGRPMKVGKRKQDAEIDAVNDIYEDPDSTISSQGSFRRSDPFFPSM